MATVVVKLKDREIRRMRIERMETTIGREPGNDLVIDNPGISRRHATLRFDGSGFVIEDTGSQNGVFVNGAKADMRPLTDSDVVQIGKFSLYLIGANDVDEMTLSNKSPFEVDEGKPVSPYETTALRPVDFDRFLDQAGLPPEKIAAFRAMRQADAQARRMDSRPTERPVLVRQPAPKMAPTVKEQRPVASPRGSVDALQAEARFFRNLAFGFGALLVGVVGVSIVLFLA